VNNNAYLYIMFVIDIE